ncbi:major facilitator superfamily domain-containing protein [Phaeosphaeriaceae sp. PMI808]|nr:major facilitator superfamily domain-containing protein [Phaeosphaeriaceae sp. PMI808]
MSEPLSVPPTRNAPMLGDRTFITSNTESTGPQQTVDNPFLTLDDTIVHHTTSRTELEDYVHHFASQSGLKHRYEMLLFGARLARNKYEAMIRYKDEITEPEKELIRTEKNKETGFWKQAKFFKATIITASLGAVIQGWTQSVNNGTAYGMPDEFNLCYKGENCTASSLWTFGMLNAIPLLSAGLFGTTLADPLQENFLGRRGSVMLSCVITVASTIGASVTRSVPQLAICRAINGIALGAKASIVPIYSAELSPEHIRGAILANWQLADTIGIFLGGLCNLLIVIYVSNPSQCWRILTNTTLIPTIPLLVMIYLMPESPRYLMKHGRYEKALDAFNQVQTTPLLAARDFMYAHAQLDFESRMFKGRANEFKNLADRVDISATNLSMRGPRAFTTNLNTSHNSISPRQSTQNEARLRPGGVLQPRDSHQHSLHDESGHDRAVGLVDLRRRESDILSLDIDLGIQTAKKQGAEKKNPYSYHIGVTGYYKRLAQLWSNLRCRRALLAASVAMISQQMTGVNTIALLGTTVWENSLVHDNTVDLRKNAQTAAIIGLAFGAANYLGGLPAYWLSDKIGRSIMLALGLPNMAWSMLIFAFLFKINDSAVQIPMVSIFAVIFVLFYASTAGTSPFSISAEVFPLVSREAGMAVAVAVNFVGCGLLALVFPFLMHRIGTTSALSIFSGLNLVAFVLVYLFVPETRMRTLEELQFTFDVPTSLHVRYRALYISKHLRQNWWKYLMRKKIADEDVPIAYYEWARIVYGQNQHES